MLRNPFYTGKFEYPVGSGDWYQGTYEPLVSQHLFEEVGKVLSIVDVVLEDLRQRAVKRVGVLAIGFTLDHRLYQNRIEQERMECEVISSEIAERLDKAIFAVMEGKDGTEEQSIAIAAVKFLHDKQVDAIVLGCSEVPLLLQERQNENHLLNPAQLLAEAAVRQAL